MSALIYLVSSVLLLCGLLAVESSGVFELRLERFEGNQLTADRSGSCCKDTTGHCTACNTFFRICLKHYQANITPDPPCTFGYLETPVITGNGINTFPQEISTISFPFAFTWPETFSVVIEAWHQPSPLGPETAHDVENNLGQIDDQLLAQLVAHRTLAVGTNWTESTFVTSASKLIYSYRVRCEENYYGAGCADLCRPRDDSFGHYTCTPNGTIVCLEGWSGPYCDKAQCAKGCQPQNGDCSVPNECKCRPGWQGKDCSECIRYPGCQKGTCQLPWQCNCEEGWGGMFCDQDLNYCTHHRPCDNGGTCTNTGLGSYKCSCQEGFIGLNCEIRKDQCESAPCQNAGKCKNSKTHNYTCECAEGFSGRNCELKLRSCSDSPCQNDAICRSSSTKGYVCLCKPGYEGVNCQTDRNDCQVNPCRNGGTCVDLPNSFSCTCPKGFGGATCHIKLIPDDCTLTPCENGGTCNYGKHGYTCTCQRGYEGPLCQTPVFDSCADNPCQHGASCEDLRGGDFVCHCPAGYVGKLCDSADMSNEIETPMKLQRIQTSSGLGLGWPEIAGIIVAFLFVVGLLFFAGIVCWMRRRRPMIKERKHSPVAELNFNMNNFQKSYHVTMPKVPQEWKPTISYQADGSDEPHYAVLPKRNNSNYVTVGDYNSAGTSPTSANRSPSDAGIYMKVVMDPSQQYRSNRKSYVGSCKADPPPSYYTEYELAENVRHPYGMEC